MDPSIMKEFNSWKELIKLDYGSVVQDFIEQFYRLHVPNDVSGEFSRTHSSVVILCIDCVASDVQEFHVIMMRDFCRKNNIRPHIMYDLNDKLIHELMAIVTHRFRRSPTFLVEHLFFISIFAHHIWSIFKDNKTSQL
jgi:hypothetical protein